MRCEKLYMGDVSRPSTPCTCPTSGVFGSCEVCEDVYIGVMHCHLAPLDLHKSEGVSKAKALFLSEN